MLPFLNSELCPVSGVLRRPPRSGILLGAGFLVFGTAALLTGCAKKSEVRAESREIRLTRGDGYKIYPCYSPDGREVVYTKMGGEQAKFNVYTVPSEGGEARPYAPGAGLRSAPETALRGQRSVGWRTDPKELFVYNFDEVALRCITPEGKVREEHRGFELAQAISVSSDGSRFLYLQYNGDNWDAGIFSTDEPDKIKFLAETEEWEVAGCFGPNPGEVTVCRKPTYQSQTGEILIWSPETESFTALPLPEANNDDPAWSPDGRFLAYGSDQSGNMDIWVYDAASNRSVQITNTPEEETHPGWSPDGEWITFSRGVSTSHVFVGDPNTFETRQLTKGESWDGHAHASKDGEWVAFARRPPAGEKRPRYRLCVAPIAGGEVRELDLGDLSLILGYRSLCWSPDGSQIAFAADDGTGNVDIYRISREGGTPERVTIAPGSDSEPGWSPDGTTIAYTRAAGGETQIWTIPATGGLARQVTFHDGLKGIPWWADDSDRIVYFTAGSRIEFEVWYSSVSNPENAQLILPKAETNYPWGWSEDGTEVLVWKKGENAKGYVLWAVSLDGSGWTKVGVEDEEDEKTKHFVKLTEEGRRYKQRIYPGDALVYTDGEHVADIYVIRVPKIIEEKLQASAGWD